ncbi:ATP11 protein-domain-containing protein [Peziza echinospora]|nr:ATP11 protein-domain-containing protein [Peziza echinospora]
MATTTTTHAVTALRRALTTSLPTARSLTQTRHARVVTNPFFNPLPRGGRSLQTASSVDSQLILEKYKEKLEQKMKLEGVKSYTDLRERYKEKIEAIKNDPTIPPLPRELLEADDPVPQPPSSPLTTSIPPPRPATPPTSTPPGVKLLSSYIDTALLPPLSPADIELIWRTRHMSNPQSICATIPTELFLQHLSNAKRHPMFILPLPRPNGATEMHFLQWTYPHKDCVTVLFTSLAAYKLHGEFAVPHTTLTYHLELMNDKKLVLAQGLVIEDRGVSVEEGKWLVLTLQRFYGASKADEKSRRRAELLESFTKGGEGFSVEAVIEESQKI